MRSGSSECQLTVAQSMSHTTTRPPGRSARCICASAAVGSATYSSTCTHSAASKSAASTGSAVASPSRNSTLAWPAQRRAATASMSGLASMPTTDPSGPISSEQLLGVEARAAADVEDALACACGERLAHERTPAAHVAPAVQRVELPRPALVEGQLALLDGQRGRLPAEGHVGMARAALRGGGEHRRARVDAHDGAVGADLVEAAPRRRSPGRSRRRGRARPGSRGQRLAHERPPPAHVARAVQRLHLPGAALVEGQLAHRLPRAA